MTISGLTALANPASSALLWLTDVSATPQDRSHSISQLATALKKLSQEVLINSGGGAISLTAWSTANLILTYAGASTVTLPQASTCVGYKVKILAGYAGAGLVTITPYSGDHIDLQGADVSIYLNNSDASMNIQKFRYVDLIAISSGYWAVIGGDYCPDQGIDTDGSHLCLGRLHNLPLRNTISRAIMTGAPLPNGYSSYQLVVGYYGIPVAAKGVRIKYKIIPYATAAGIYNVDISFTDNNSYTPAQITAHASLYIGGYATGAGLSANDGDIIDIPLNSSGGFYIYGSSGTNITHLNCITYATVIGFYMGD
jgi:hypothetical protein